MGKNKEQLNNQLQMMLIGKCFTQMQRFTIAVSDANFTKAKEITVDIEKAMDEATALSKDV